MSFLIKASLDVKRNRRVLSLIADMKGARGKEIRRVHEIEMESATR